MIRKFTQTLDTDTFDCGPKDLKGSLDKLASEIVTPEHDFKNQMKDALLTKLIGQPIIHHHVRNELGES